LDQSFNHYFELKIVLFLFMCTADQPRVPDPTYPVTTHFDHTSHSSVTQVDNNSSTTAYLVPIQNIILSLLFYFFVSHIIIIW